MFERLKSLLSQTAIYGLSSILGRLLNFVLVPIHTAALTQTEFGINTDIYTLIGFLIVISTYGMETAFFRYSEKPDYNKEDVYKTTFYSIVGTSLILLLFSALFFGDITRWMRYEDYPQFVLYLVIILMLDTLAAIPFARLRAQNRAFRFVSIKLALIGVNVLMNLFFFLYCPWAMENGGVLAGWIEGWYQPELKVQYIFLSNIVASTVMFVMLLPEIFSIKGTFNLETLEKTTLVWTTAISEWFGRGGQ